MDDAPRTGLARRIPVSLALTAFVTLVFALELSLGAWSDQSVLYRMGAMHPDRVVEANEWWRLITAMFLHNGWLHFVLNTLALIQLAALVELIYGSRRLVGFFFVTGLVGSLMSTLLSPPWMIGGVGASGALYGLVGLLMTLAITGPDRWREQLQGPLRALVWALAFGVAIAIAETLMVDLFLGVRVIDHAAHFGGFVTGVLLGFAYPDPRAPLTPGERVLAYGVAGVVVGAFGLAASTGDDAMPEIQDDIVASMAMRLERAPNDTARMAYAAGLPQLYADMGIEDAEAAYREQIRTLSPSVLGGVFGTLHGQGFPQAELDVAERWVALAPEDPHAANGLAWLLVTHEDPQARDPERALALVDRALAQAEDLEPNDLIDTDDPLMWLQVTFTGMDTSPEAVRGYVRATFLDTRAEALYQLGRYPEALTDQTEAVRLGEEWQVGPLEEMKERLARIEDALES